jgi:hypothetical protein
MNSEGSIEQRQASLSSRPALKNFQLMAKSEAGKEAVEKGTKDCLHALNAMACHCKTLGFLRRMEFMGGTAQFFRVGWVRHAVGK